MKVLVVLCFAHMELFCVDNLFVGGRVMSSCRGGGVVDDNGGMVGRGKVPVYTKYTTVYFGVYGRILRSIRQEYFSNTLRIPTNTLECVGCNTLCECMEPASWFFDRPPLVSRC